MNRALPAAMVLAFAAAASAATERDQSTARSADASATRFHTEAVASLSPNEVVIERRGDRILVRAQSEVDADLGTIWSTLSDYDHLARFIPDMSSSRTISRDNAGAVVQQEGFARFGPLRQGFTALFAVREERDRSISVSCIGGDFKLFDARYEIVPLTPHRSRIVYQATIVPSLAVPSLVEVPLMRSMVGRQFSALVREVLRRAGNT